LYTCLWVREGEVLRSSDEDGGEAAAADDGVDGGGLLPTQLIVGSFARITAGVGDTVARGATLVAVADLARGRQLWLVEHARSLHPVVVVIDGDGDGLVVRDPIVPVGGNRDTQLVPRDLWDSQYHEIMR
jgi:hypothetical protein